MRTHTNAHWHTHSLVYTYPHAQIYSHTRGHVNTCTHSIISRRSIKTPAARNENFVLTSTWLLFLILPLYDAVTLRLSFKTCVCTYCLRWHPNTRFFFFLLFYPFFYTHEKFTTTLIERTVFHMPRSSVWDLFTMISTSIF